VSRNPKIEAIVEAWYELDHCPHSKRSAAELKLNQLLDQTIGRQPVTREQLLDHLYSHYLEYRRVRRANEKLQTARAPRQR